MRIEYQSEQELSQSILSVIGHFLDLKKYHVFFFGSRVLGKGTDRSDIDVGIEGKKPIPLPVLLDIQEAMEELPTLYTIDIVDFNRLESNFKKVAKQRVEYIHP